MRVMTRMGIKLSSTSELMLFWLSPLWHSSHERWGSFEVVKNQATWFSCQCCWRFSDLIFSIEAYLSVFFSSVTLVCEWTPLRKSQIILLDVKMFGWPIYAQILVCLRLGFWEFPEFASQYLDSVRKWFFLFICRLVIVVNLDFCHSFSFVYL